MDLPRVKRRIGPKEMMSPGKGFSEAELKEVGLSSPVAGRLGIPNDDRRRTKHQENINRLQEWITSTGKTASELARSAVPVSRGFKSGPHAGRAFRGLTSSGRRTRGLLRSRG